MNRTLAWWVNYFQVGTVNEVGNGAVVEPLDVSCQPLMEHSCRVIRRMQLDQRGRHLTHRSSDGDLHHVNKSRAGIVTLPCGERKASAAQELSGGRERGPPRVHRRSAKHAVRLG